MVETVGALILTATGLTEVVGIAGLGTLATTTIAGVSIATVVGTAAVIGVSVGLQYALAGNPQLPRPEEGSQAIKQSIPPRQRGYGINRLAGAYMLFEAADTGGPPATSYDVIAFHSGRVDSLIGFYFSDDPISTTPSILTGGTGTVNGSPDGAYGGSNCGLQVRLGTVPQSAISSFAPLWDATHDGNGIAHAGIICGGLVDPQTHTQIYPRGHPELSVVANCSPVWDPRDPGQLEGDESTWEGSFNPVLQLLDYITRADGGLGQERSIAVPDGEVLDAWMAEADLCDEIISARPRYASHGWFKYDSSPEDVVNSILSACDGWMAEAGDGNLSLVVGYYRAPTDPPITDEIILGFSLNCGQPDESIVNVLNVTFTDPDNKYVTTQLDDVRDELSISETGVARPKPLQLTWVQSAAQAEMLGERAMSRLNPRRTGTLITNLVGLRYLGKRWVKLQFPFISDLEDCVIEIQPSPKIDLLGGRVTFTWNLVDVEALLAAQ